MSVDFTGNSSSGISNALNNLQNTLKPSFESDLYKNPFNTSSGVLGASSYNSFIDNTNIATNSKFIDNSSSNFVGELNKPSDDTYIYANQGVIFNGAPTLSSLPGALTIGANGTVSVTDKLTGIQYLRTSELLPINVPYDELLSPGLHQAPSKQELVFNPSQKPLNTATDVIDAFKPNDSDLSIVNVVGGGLNLPSSSLLRNTIITVENGDINFNGSSHELDNVTLIAKNGNVNLSGIKAANLSVFASGSISFNQAASFSGENLLATKNGNVIFSGKTVTEKPSDSINIFGNGNITINNELDAHADFLASGSFTVNGASKIVGSIKTQGDIIFNASVQVFADVINPNQPAIVSIDTGVNANNPFLDYRRLIPVKDYVDNDNNPFLSPGEGNEHGTHNTGIIYSINNEAPIFIARAIGSGKLAEALIDSVDAAKQSGQANVVVNLALDLTQVNPDGTVTTRYEFTPQEREALEYARQKGVLIVAAAGNDGGTMSALGQASQEFDNIITVGSVDYNNKRADYSSFGYGLDIMAYGGTVDEPVLSTVGNGTDLKFLVEGLDELANNMEGLAQFIPSFDIPDDLANFEDQAYKLALKEVSDMLVDSLSISNVEISNEENVLVTNLEESLGEFESLLNTLQSDFLNVLNEPEVANLLTFLEESDITADQGLDNGIGEMAGTSVATAKVAGAVSQIWAANPGLNPIQIKGILKKTAVDLEAPGWDEETGAGLLNPAAAIDVAKTTQPEIFQPEAFSIPTTWNGEGLIKPSERAVSTEFMGKYYDWVPYTIPSGDTLSEIALRTMGSSSASYYNFIARKNNIANPNLIYAGRTILIPQQVSVSQPQPQIQLQTQPQTQPQIQPQTQPQSTTSTVQGGIRQRWTQNPWLGAPTSGEIRRGNGVTIQYFANGYIIWNGKIATAYRNVKNSSYSNGQFGKSYQEFKKPIEITVKAVKAADFARRFMSPRGVSKIASDFTSKINNIRTAKWIGMVPFANKILPWVQKNVKPVLYGVRRFLIKNVPVISKISRFIAKPAVVQTAKAFGRFVPFLNLAVTAIDVGLDLATAKTEEQKKKAQVKAWAGAAGAVVGGVIGGVLGAGAGGVGAVPGAVGGAGLGASLATTAVDAAYWVNDNKDKIGNFFSNAGNKFKSAFGF